MLGERMAKSAKEFQVDTSPTKEVVVDSITRDATDEECVCDLIDNAIDAARNAIFSNIAPKLRNELPARYDGYEVKLSLDSGTFKIVDNCGGIPIEALKKVALKFGEQSAQAMGIGAFGVGLNRALFRLGNFATITTETLRERAEVVLEKDKYLKKPANWTLPGEQLAMTGKAGTTIEIRGLPTGTSGHFGDPRWITALEHQIGRRYGRFIQKGIVIWLNGKKVANEEIQIRDDGIYEPREKFVRTSDNVLVNIKYGQHKLHKFPGEKGCTDEQNRRLTPQYGWTVLCNDRAVLLSDKTSHTGWDITKFHSDFYGFVGYVNFISEDPRKLPWNTTKTDVDLNNTAYQEALEDMRRFTKEWRSAANQRKRAKELPAPLPPKKQKPAESSVAKTSKAKTSPPAKPKIVTKQDHNSFREVLPSDINEVHCFDKHLALVRQAKKLDMAECSYAGLALLRMLFETSSWSYVERKGQLDDMKKFALERRKRKGWEPKPGQEGKVTISMDEMLAYFEHNPNIWGDAKQAYTRHIVGKLKGYQPTMNSALHHPLQVIAATKAIEIRDEALPLLRHLIEK
jgi:hypothetical protein